jgi:hypothetical protein
MDDFKIPASFEDIFSNEENVEYGFDSLDVEISDFDQDVLITQLDGKND